MAASKPSRPRAKRIDVNIEFDSIGDFVREYVSNVSRSGAFVRSDDPLPVGTRVRLKFTVMVEDPEVIEGVGEVMRVSERPRGMGVVFRSLDEPSERLLERLLIGPKVRRRRR